MFTTKARRHPDFLVVLCVLVPLWSACRVNCVPPGIEGKIRTGAAPLRPIRIKLSDSSRTSGACGQASTGVDAAVRAGGRPGAERRSAPTGAISNRPRLTLMPMGMG